MNNDIGKQHPEIADPRDYDRMRAKFLAMGETEEITDKIVELIKRMDLHLDSQIEATEKAEARAREIGMSHSLLHGVFYRKRA